MDENQILVTANNLGYVSPEKLIEMYVEKGYSEGDAYLLVKAGQVYNEFTHGGENNIIQG